MGPRRSPSWSSPPTNMIYRPLPCQLEYPWLAFPTAQGNSPAHVVGTSHGALYPCIAAQQVPLGPVTFDLRAKPWLYNPQEYNRHCGYSLFEQPTRHMRLICKHFPWTIEITDRWVTCAGVWDAIYDALQEPMTDAEWAIVSQDDDKKREVESAMRRRREQYHTLDPAPRRIDWLCDMTLFRGLERDDAYAEKVLLPGKDQDMETCVIRLDANWPRR